jgi:hypothetical protein
LKDYDKEGNLIEILVSDQVSVPSIERRNPGLRVTVPTVISYDKIIEALGQELTAVQAMEVFELWCNDNALRKITKTPEGWLRTLREHSSAQLIRKRTLSSTIHRP